MLTAIVQSVEVSTLKTSACLPIQIRIRRSTSGQTVRLRNAMASASQTSAVDRRRWRALPRYVPCAPMLIGQDEHPRARRQAARRAVYSVTRQGPLGGSNIRIPDARGTAVSCAPLSLSILFEAIIGGGIPRLRAGHDPNSDDPLTAAHADVSYEVSGYLALFC